MNEIILMVAAALILASFVKVQAALDYQMRAAEAAGIGLVLMVITYFGSMSAFPLLAEIVAVAAATYKLKTLRLLELAKAVSILSIMLWAVFFLRVAEGKIGVGFSPRYINTDAILLLVAILQVFAWPYGKGEGRTLPKLKLKGRAKANKRSKTTKRSILRRDTAQEAVAAAVPPERNDDEENRIPATWKITGVAILALIIMAVVWMTMKAQLYLPPAA